jgi:hypothetical protein
MRAGPLDDEPADFITSQTVASGLPPPLTKISLGQSYSGGWEWQRDGDDCCLP